jgi:hypothetical protein
MLAGALVTLPLPTPPSAMEIVWVLGTNEAVTDRAPFIVRAQEPVPVQEPPQPPNDWFAAGVAVRPTAMPAAKLAWQVPPLATPLVMVQLMPAGELVTVPLPVPPPVTVTVWTSWLNEAVTGFAASATSWQLPLPLQLPLQPPKLLVAPEVGVSVMTVPTGKSLEQVPPAAPLVTVHEMPAGLLCTEPLPLPFGVMLIA